MTGHRAFTLGMDRAEQIVEQDCKGRVGFIAQHVAAQDFGDPVFAPFVLRPLTRLPLGH